MAKSRETIEEEAIEIVDKLLQHGLIPTSDAVILIRAITDKDTNMDMTYESEIQTKLGCAVMLNSAFGVWDIE